MGDETSTTTWAVRPVTRDDAEAVTTLMAAAEAVDRTDEHYDVDDVLEMLDDPQVDLARDWLVAEQDGVLVGQCHLVPRAPADGVQKLYVEGTTHPEHRGRGIGTDLLGRVVERGQAHAAEHDARAVLSATAPSDMPDAEALHLAHGFVPDRWTFVMEAALADVTEPPAPPAGFRLETWEGADPEELREAHNRAFVDHPGSTPWSAAMWEQWVTGSRNDRPALSVVLRDDAAGGAVAAYVHCQEFEAVAAVTGRRETFVGKVGTVPAYRRRGLAALALRHAMWRHAQAGFVATSLDVDSVNPSGANGLYESVGFRVTRTWTNFLRAG